jgi:hypothetical protein
MMVSQPEPEPEPSATAKAVPEEPLPPIAEIVDALGGSYKVARRIGVVPSAIEEWCRAGTAPEPYNRKIREAHCYVYPLAAHEQPPSQCYVPPEPPPQTDNRYVPPPRPASPMTTVAPPQPPPTAPGYLVPKSRVTEL